MDEWIYMSSLPKQTTIFCVLVRQHTGRYKDRIGGPGGVLPVNCSASVLGLSSSLGDPLN